MCVRVRERERAEGRTRARPLSHTTRGGLAWRLRLVSHTTRAAPHSSARAPCLAVSSGSHPSCTTHLRAGTRPLLGRRRRVRGGVRPVAVSLAATCAPQLRARNDTGGEGHHPAPPCATAPLIEPSASTRLTRPRPRGGQGGGRRPRRPQHPHLPDTHTGCRGLPGAYDTQGRVRAPYARGWEPDSPAIAGCRLTERSRVSGGMAALFCSAAGLWGGRSFVSLVTRKKRISSSSSSSSSKACKTAVRKRIPSKSQVQTLSCKKPLYACALLFCFNIM